MAFTFTVNGRTYTEADFTPTLYHLNYPEFIRDCAEHASYSLSAPGTTEGLGIATPTSILVHRGRNFCVGMPIVIFSPTMRCTFFATITAYNATYTATHALITCTVHTTLGTPYDTELGDWTVVAGGSSDILSATPYTGSSALLSSSISDIKSHTKEGYPSNRIKPFYEDFCGYIPSVEGLATGSVVQSNLVPGLHIEVGGIATASFDGNQTEAFADGNCPGVAVLTVTSPYDYVWISGEGKDAGDLETLATFRIFIPRSQEGQEIEFFVGYSLTPTSPSSSAPQYLYGVHLCFNHAATANADGTHPIEDRYNAQPDGNYSDNTVFDRDSIWEQGRWITVWLFREVAATFQRNVYDGPGATLSDYTEFSEPNYQNVWGAPVTGAFPFIWLRKKTGNLPSKLYVDYMTNTLNSSGLR